VSMPTLRDVAARAGVHPGTVSRALNPETRALVKPQTAQRVLKAAEALGYQPNPIARGLKTNRSMTVGVVIPDLTNPLFPPIVRGIEDVLMPAGYSPLLINTDNNAEREAQLVSSLRGRQVDGFLFATARLKHQLIADLAAEGVPIVLVNRRLDTPDLPTVTTDDGAGVVMALRHLVDLGHSEIAYIAGPRWTSTGQARLRAFKMGMADLGLDSSRVVESNMWSEQQGEEALEKLLDRFSGFTAVLAGNDLLALGCYDLMQKRSIDCPGELSVVGFNNMPLVDKVRPALTTVGLPHYQIGSEAARLLLERIRQPQAPPKSVLLPLSLVVRESTAPPRSGSGSGARSVARVKPRGPKPDSSVARRSAG
jgi:LacI family transcriptional regulator